jgi:hypothetical protein
MMALMGLVQVLVQVLVRAVWW